MCASFIFICLGLLVPGAQDVIFSPIFNSTDPLSSQFLNVSGFLKSWRSLIIENVLLILGDSINNVSYSMNFMHINTDEFDYLQRKTLAWFAMPISLYDEGKTIVLALKYKTNSVKFYYSVMQTTYSDNIVIIEKAIYYFNVHFSANVQIVYYEDAIFYGQVTSDKNGKITFKKSVTFYSNFVFNGQMVNEGSLIQAQFSTRFDEERIFLTPAVPVNYFQRFNSM